VTRLKNMIHLFFIMCFPVSASFFLVSIPPFFYIFYSRHVWNEMNIGPPDFYNVFPSFSLFFLVSIPPFFYIFYSRHVWNEMNIGPPDFYNTLLLWRVINCPHTLFTWPPLDPGNSVFSSIFFTWPPTRSTGNLFLCFWCPCKTFPTFFLFYVCFFSIFFRCPCKTLTWGIHLFFIWLCGMYLYS